MQKLLLNIKELLPRPSRWAFMKQNKGKKVKIHIAKTLLMTFISESNIQEAIMTTLQIFFITNETKTRSN